jgi:hypothetical protein
MTPGRRKSTWRETRSKKIANGFFALQILLFREENSRQSRSLHSHSSFCEEVFSRSEPDWRIPESVYSERGPRTLKSGFSVTLANEADRFEYSGSWLAARRSFGLTFFPPSPLFGTRAFCLCAKRTLCPLFCFSGVGTPLGAQTTSLCSIAKRLACGKSYPVTAAQLLRLYTGFLAPIHLVQTRKELSEQ